MATDVTCRHWETLTTLFIFQSALLQATWTVYAIKRYFSSVKVQSTSVFVKMSRCCIDNTEIA